MYKAFISSLLLVLFLAFISAPTIIHSIDKTIDVSFFYSITEEEERGHQTVKNFQIVTSDFKAIEFVCTSKPIDPIGYKFKTYPKPHLNLISPPPEQNIL